MEVVLTTNEDQSNSLPTTMAEATTITKNNEDSTTAQPEQQQQQQQPSKRSLKRKAQEIERKRYRKEHEKKKKQLKRQQKEEQRLKEEKEGPTVKKEPKPFNKPPAKLDYLAGPDSLHIILDLSFDDQMTEKEVKHVSQQFSFCYNANRKSSTPCHVHITSFGGKTKKDIEGKFEYQKWKNVVVDEQPYIDLFDKTKLVYLTADSTNVLENLNPEHYYIIGAIVDHNRLKNATKLLADQQGIATARLPIDEHLKLSTRKVLTINHVFEILVKFQETKNWQDTLMSCIPIRKGAELLSSSSSSSSSSSASSSPSDTPTPTPSSDSSSIRTEKELSK